MTDFDLCIVGAGVVGLALAHSLSAHYSVLVIEQHDRIGSETSARNSEVIHAGLYYPANSLKERLCIRGRKLLYDYCQTHHVEHQQIGKLIVAPTADHPKLAALASNAKRLGIPLTLLDRQQLHKMEPEVAAEAALWSPETGIIDSHGLMMSLLSQAQQQGATLTLNTRFRSANPAKPLASNRAGQKDQQGHWQVSVDTADGPFEFSCSTLINSAGLNAVDLYQALNSTQAPSTDQPEQQNKPERDEPELKQWPARGHYFSYQGRSPFSHLVYPLPEPGLAGLGIHATLDLGKQLRFGPDVQFLTRSQYQSNQRYAVAENLKEHFAEAIRQYWPTLNSTRLQPDYAGIRPKLSGPGMAARDFEIRTQQIQQATLVNLLGIESPGLTASLAIAEYVTEQLLERRIV